MALKASYADAFTVEPGGLSDTDSTTSSSSSDDEVRYTPDVRSHCWFPHRKCKLLSSRLGRCLCGQFLLARCETEMSLSGQTWVDMLYPLLKGIDYGVWGCGSLRGRLYHHVIVFRVRREDDREKLLKIINERYIDMRGDEFASDGTRELCCDSSCCYEDFFSRFRLGQKKEGEADMTFGAGQICEDVWKLYNRHWK